MASTFFRTRDRIESELEDQVARLTREVAHLRKAAAKRGSHAYSDARDTMSEFYEDAIDRIYDTLPDIRSGAKRARKTVEDNPALTAAAGLVLVGVLAAILLRR